MMYNFDEIIPREETNCIKYDLRKEYFGSENLIPMWVADMDFRTPDFIMEAIRQRAEHEILGYSARGEGFFDAIIGWYSRRYNWEIQKDWIVTTPGVVPALHFAIRAFTAPGEKVLIQPPVYHPFFSIIKGNERVVVSNQLILKHGRYRMNIKDLKEKVDKHTKLILLSHPHNPVGRVWTEEELTEIGEFCTSKGITILCDEIHSDLVYSPNRHIPMASINKELLQHTITFDAPSKTFNLAGLTTSFVIIPDSALRQLFNRELETSHLWLGNLFGSIALEAAYSSGDQWLDQLMNYLKDNLEFMKAFISGEIPSVKVIEPEATYLVWLDMRQISLKEQTMKDFLVKEARLGFNDGASFGPGGEGFQRINIACPRSVLEKALVQLRDALGSRKKS